MKKRFAALALTLCLTLSTLTASAGAASYFPRYTGGSGSIAAALDSLGADSSYSNRVKIAAVNGVSGYRGTAGQNTQLLALLKQGTLIDPSVSESACFPAYTGSSPSIVAALSALGVDSSFSYRTRIAAANGVSSYSGSAVQNTNLLQLLRQGKLVRPGSFSASAPAASGGLTTANLGRVSFLRQDTNTCKATSAAMAVNLLLGRDRYSTADMIYSGVLCRSLDGDVYTGSLPAALPIVAPVHSSATRHHWIVLVGRDSQGNYLAVDPARNGSGTMASQAKSMAAMGYSFGLTDYATPHYGYISFQRA